MKIENDTCHQWDSLKIADQEIVICIKKERGVFYFLLGIGTVLFLLNNSIEELWLWSKQTLTLNPCELLLQLRERVRYEFSK